jgi:hypothetical protein
MFKLKPEPLIMPPVIFLICWPNKPSFGHLGPLSCDLAPHFPSGTSTVTRVVETQFGDVGCSYKTHVVRTHIAFIRTHVVRTFR